MTLCRSFGIALLCVGSLVTTAARADVLSTIKEECAILGATRYQIVFVTSDGTTATSANIQDYNNFVTAEAVLGSSYLSDFVPAGTTWKAIGSTDSVNAIVNSPTYANVPIFNTQGELIATGSTQFWNASFDTPILFDQYGNSNSGGYVWIGTQYTGREASLSGVPAGLGDFPYIGTPLDAYCTPTCTQANVTYGFNILWNQTGYSLSAVQAYSCPLYALSSPIPEPSTITLLGSALLGLGLVCRRRRLVRC